MRHLSPELATLLRRWGVAPADDWSEDAPSPANLLARERVQLDEAVRRGATAARTRATVPTPLAGGATCVTLDVDAGTVPPEPALHRHQREALAATCARLDAAHVEARSGTWIMPCGTGKTLTGAVLATALGAADHGDGLHTLVLVPNTETAAQWASELARAGVQHVAIAGVDHLVPRALLGLQRKLVTPRVVLLSWPALVAHLRAPVADAAAGLLCAVELQSYDLLLIDEVHMLPATTHLAAARRVAARVVIGMTAELTRSDGQHDELRALLPVLYEMSVAQAQALGVALRVRPVTVLVPMDAALLAAHDAERSPEARRLLALLNPQKFAALRTLLTVSERAQKVIVYCDKLRALPIVERVLGAIPDLVFVGTLSGNKTGTERRRVCDALRAAPHGVALLTRAGSASIDVRDLDCIIELDVCDAGVQKHTQRGGRAARVHHRKLEARRFTLASLGTREVFFARKRAMNDPSVEERQPEAVVAPAGALAPADVVAFVARACPTGRPASAV